MASPEFHRRQAEIFTRLAKSSHDPHTRDELLRLAAEHSEWARRGDSVPSRNTPPKSKNQEVA